MKMYFLFCKNYFTYKESKKNVLAYIIYAFILYTTIILCKYIIN